eukprot:6203547-Pleurochrysis_carterae.AAC.2
MSCRIERDTLLVHLMPRKTEHDLRWKCAPEGMARVAGKTKYLRKNINAPATVANDKIVKAGARRAVLELEDRVAEASMFTLGGLGAPTTPARGCITESRVRQL